MTKRNRKKRRELKSELVKEFLAKEQKNEEWLSLAIGVRYNSIRNYLKGICPHKATLDRLAELMSCEPGDLIK